MKNTQFHSAKGELKNKIEGKKWLIQYEAEKLVDPKNIIPKILPFVMRKLFKKKKTTNFESLINKIFNTLTH